MHILSLLLGFTSWGLGLWALVRRSGYGLCFFSFLSCGAALWLQLKELQRVLLIREDISAAMDTITAVVLAATVLVTVTALLNGAALLRSHKQNQI